MNCQGIITFLAATLLCTLASARDSITLRPQATAAKTLADIAILDGLAAESLSETDVASAVESSGNDRRITLESLRQLLEKNEAINWGRITLSGSRCVIRELRRSDEQPVARNVSPLAQQAPPPGTPTIRDLVTARIADSLRINPDDLRLTFDERCSTALNTPLNGRTADIQLLGTSDRQLVAVKIFEGGSIALQENVRANVTIRRTVGVATEGISRAQPLLETSFTTEERWLPPSAHPADIASLAGQSARVALRAGEVIEHNDTEQPQVIKKGDLVDVHCLSGSIHLKIVARALEPAKVGQTVRFQATDSKRTFTARADGPNRAVTIAQGTPAAHEPTPSPQQLPPADPRRTREKAKRGNRYADLADRPLPAAPPTGTTQQ